MTTDFSSSDNIIDVRDIIARVEELRSERENLQDTLDEAEEAYKYHDSDDTQSTPEYEDLQEAKEAREEWDESDEAKELETLEELLSDLCGYGGDEQWEGDWYPVTLINQDHFTDYAQELAEETGSVNRDARWPNNHIDWDAAADDLKQDYSTVDFEGVSFYYRG